MTLLEQFDAMPTIPVIEILSYDGWHDFWLDANAAGIQVQYSDIFVAWDDVFTLDEHLQHVHEIILERFS